VASPCGAGLIWGYMNTNQYYVTYLETDSSLVVAKWLSGSYIEMVNVSTSCDRSRWNELRVGHDGSQSFVVLDDMWSTSFIDPNGAFTEGRVGLYTRHCRADFARFYLYQENEAGKDHAVFHLVNRTRSLNLNAAGSGNGSVTIDTRTNVNMQPLLLPVNDGTSPSNVRDFLEEVVAEGQPVFLEAEGITCSGVIDSVNDLKFIDDRQRKVAGFGLEISRCDVR
jgi:hypothetical protein